MLLRKEHIYQKYEKIGNVLNIALADLITDHRVLEANFLYAGGDTRKDKYSQFPTAHYQIYAYSYHQTICIRFY